jgi:hypothetical protein
MSPMRLIRNPLSVITVLSAALILMPFGASAVSAATAASTITYCTSPCRMIYPGGTDQPDGPKGPLSPTEWTPYALPETITTTNEGSLNEIANWDPPGGCVPFLTNCGEWRYDKSSVELVNFKWVLPGGASEVVTTPLQSIPVNSAWINLPGGGYAAKCLQWTYEKDDYVIGLNVDDGYTWSEMTQAECYALPSVLPPS